MNTMKLLGILLLTISLTKCASTKFENKPPFSIIKTELNDENLNYSELKLYLKKETSVSFKELFFKGKKVELQKDDNMLLAKFPKNTISKRNDLNLYGDSKREFGNSVKIEKFPFEIKNNEAILSYFQSGKLKYFKIENIQ